MAAIISLMIILTLSILITRIATVALAQTGLSRESARFQARSAFTGVGFTTSESENVVSHPVRRRILMFLMLLVNVGIVTAISTLILSFINPEGSRTVVLHLIYIVTGLVLLWLTATSQWIDQKLSAIISRWLKRYSQIDVMDYASLLHLTGDYRISELQPQKNSWLANSTLARAKLREEGIIVLGITRSNGKYIGAPTGDTKLLAGDSIIVYGRTACLQKLNKRRKGRGGDSDHDSAVAEQETLERNENREDPAQREEG